MLKCWILILTKKEAGFVQTKKNITNEEEDCMTKFVFIGASGATLPLLKCRNQRTERLRRISRERLVVEMQY